MHFSQSDALGSIGHEECIFTFLAAPPRLLETNHPTDYSIQFTTNIPETYSIALCSLCTGRTADGTDR